ncbi:MAG: hypothetical protein ABJA98_28020 [Acidobacteriota bacterium]
MLAKLDAYTVDELHEMLRYERNVEQRRSSAQRVVRSLKRAARLEAELTKRVSISPQIGSPSSSMTAVSS